MDKVYIVTMSGSINGESTHRFSASSIELAERAALIKYPYKTIEKVEEVK